MVMDMDVMAESEAPTRTGTPETKLGGVFEDGRSAERVADKENVPLEPPRKMGNLMKELKQDVQQGGMEFNMDNFF
jgi:hypothetical protein